MRQIIHERTEPYRIKLKDIPGVDKIQDRDKFMEFEVHICGCGLSHDKPFCDGSHKITRDEDPSLIYTYSESKERLIAGKYYSKDKKI
jgi:CDGSH-type Zn-finger protein